MLTVADTGVGIAEEDRDIIFEKFRQSGSILGEDGLTREYSGTGLGLSIVKELCKLLRGEISFESELGRGSTFRVVLPWVAADRSPRESRINVQLHDLAAPSADEFKGPRCRTARGTTPRQGRIPSAVSSSTQSRCPRIGLPMTQDGQPLPGATVHRRGLQRQSRARAAGPSSCAIWPPAQEKEASGGERDTTNNRMELLAVIRGLEALKRPCRVELFTDSVYVGKGLEEWLPKWKQNGWRRREGQRWVPVKNEELWRRLDELAQQHHIKYTRVAGHSGHPENERCDELAVAACERVRKPR